MLKKFLPADHFDSVFEITPEYLKEKQIYGIITDLDNTLVAWDEPEATPEIIEWFKKLEDNGIQVAIVSNNSSTSRVRIFSEPLGIPYYSKARKPLNRTFHKAMKAIDVPKDNIAVVGDQLMTDVFGGNRLGVHTILVVPVSPKDGLATQLNRKMERMILGVLKRKGMLKWED